MTSKKLKELLEKKDDKGVKDFAQKCLTNTPLRIRSMFVELDYYLTIRHERSATEHYEYLEFKDGLTKEDFIGFCLETYTYWEEGKNDNQWMK